MIAQQSDNWRELALGSILTSPFLFFSLCFHVLIGFALAELLLSIRPPESNLSIPVNLIDFGVGKSVDKSIGPKRGPGGPRSLPQQGTPVPPREARGKVDSGSTETAAPEAKSTPSPQAEPSLPGPKVLTAAPTPVSRINETSPDSLVQLPTKQTSSNVSSAVTSLPSRTESAGKDAGGAGVRALKEGAEIPGALRGTGSGAGPYGVPGGVKEGKGIAGGGTGSGTGGGSSSGLRGKFNADYGQYLKSIEKRVYSVWKYPEGASGIQRVSVRFALDRAGKLTLAEVVDSTDPQINASALEAMKKASPFPPIPESLKDLADEPLIIRFTVSVRMKG